jgi:predicted amidohydrolase YtcJ
MARVGSRRCLREWSTRTPWRAAACVTRSARKTPFRRPDTLTEDMVPERGRMSIALTGAAASGYQVAAAPDVDAAYQTARDAGRLHVRAELMVASDALHAIGAHPADGIEVGLDLGMRTGFGDDWLRLGPMKIFTDGSLVGRTAAMSAPYEGQPGNSG